MNPQNDAFIYCKNKLCNMLVWKTIIQRDNMRSGLQYADKTRKIILLDHLQKNAMLFHEPNWHQTSTDQNTFIIQNIEKIRNVVLN